MIDLNACLADVIGLSKTSCECWDADKPVAFDTSRSGLYLSDAVLLKTTQGAADCEQGGVWDLAETARNNAINALIADLPTALSYSQTDNFKPFLGWIGSPRYSQTLAVLFNGNYTGLRFKPNRINGGKVILRGVELCLENFTAPLNVPIYVYSNRDFSTPLATTTAVLNTTGAFTLAEFSTPVEIDLSDKDADGYTYEDNDLEFFIIYQMPVGARYANNLLYSGCNSCNGNNSINRIAQNPFLQYGYFEGVESPTIAGFAAPTSADQNARGMRLKADFGCNGLEWLCGLTYEPNAIGAGEHKAYAAAIAQAIFYKAGYFLASAILNSSNVNAITLLSSERLLGKTQTFKANYKEMLQWLSDNFPHDLSDCISCKSNILKGTLKL